MTILMTVVVCRIYHFRRTSYIDLLRVGHGTHVAVRNHLLRVAALFNRAS